MRIPFTNIQIGTVTNLDKRQPTRTKLIEQIVQRQLFRTSQDVEDWRRAVDVAKSTEFPDRTALIKVYNDVMLDGHINGILNSIKNKIKAKKFFVTDANGERSDERTEQLQKQWYFKFIDWTIESRFWGFSLIQLGDIVDDGFPDIELVPREYVVPDLEVVKKDLHERHIKTGFHYMESPLDDWFVFIGDKKDLGLLDKATPHSLAKKNLFSDAWEYSEIFGMPLRLGKTNIKDTERRKQMEKMMSQMGSAPWGVFDTDDTVDFVESTKSDATKVFLDPIRMSNEEISKLFAGQVAVFDEKAFVGSAEVQERLFNEFILSFMREIQFVINDQLFPKMVFHRIMDTGNRFEWEVEQERVSVTDKTKMIVDLSQHYTISPEIVMEQTGIEVEEKEDDGGDPSAKMKSVMNQVDKLYSKWTATA